MYTDRQVERVNERETERIPVQGCDAESQSIKPNGFMQRSFRSQFHLVSLILSDTTHVI